MLPLYAAVVYDNFCANIEPDEVIYLAQDVSVMLRQAVAAITIPGRRSPLELADSHHGGYLPTRWTARELLGDPGLRVFAVEEGRVAIVVRLWAKTPCPIQIRA